MRLIHVDTLDLKLFNDSELPKYAILSHTWGDGEVSFQDMQEIGKQKRISSILANKSSFTNETTLAIDAHLMFPAFQLLFDGKYSTAVQEALGNSEKSFTSRSGYQKIVNCAQEAKRLGLQYIWVDTCCIDKTSSAELQEAINSMYRYYKNSSICLVYLGDAMPVVHDFKTVLAASRWVTRGWTLQELIAPRDIRFFARDWSDLCSKVDCIEELSEVTGIPANVLETCDPSQACIAQRMSWASNRSTTRIEDRAYCLLGIFDIQMPMLYGEGEKAFFRLQEEILKAFDDYSIFAWSTDQPQQSTKYRGLLARSPSEFKRCGGYELHHLSRNPALPITSTNLGLQVQFDMWGHRSDDTTYLASLRTFNSRQELLGVVIKKLEIHGYQYARTGCEVLAVMDGEFNVRTPEARLVSVRQKLSIPPLLYDPGMYSFFLRKGTLKFARLSQVWPPGLWDAERMELSIPPGQDCAYGVLFFRLLKNDVHGFQMVVCFQRRSRDYWCKFVRRDWALLSAADPAWLAYLNEIESSLASVSIISRKFSDIYVAGPLKGDCLKFEGEIVAGLSGDRIALEIQIRDTLEKWN